MIESADGLVLVDTGFGTQDYIDPTRLVRWFMSALRVCDIRQAALRQVQRLGFRPEDVRHIVMTHMHIDHAGGLPDFPWANVHLYSKEYQAIQNPQGFFERFYIPAHWAHGPKWVLHQLGDDHWYGLAAARILDDPQVWMIPLHGHSRGHCGIAIRTGDGWLLHAGDSTYPLSPQKLGNSTLDWIVRPLAGNQIPRLRQLVRCHGRDVQVITSHFGSFDFA